MLKTYEHLRRRSGPWDDTGTYVDANKMLRWKSMDLMYKPFYSTIVLQLCRSPYPELLRRLHGQRSLGFLLSMRLTRFKYILPWLLCRPSTATIVSLKQIHSSIPSVRRWVMYAFVSIGRPKLICLFPRRFLRWYWWSTTVLICTKPGSTILPSFFVTNLARCPLLLG